MLRMLRTYRRMNQSLMCESCSLRVQRDHHEHGLGCRVIRMERKTFEGRREALRLAAVIAHEKRRRIEAEESLRRKWTWPCCSMLWDAHHAYGFPLEAPVSCRSLGPWEEQDDAVHESPEEAPSREDWSRPLAPPADSSHDWDLWDGGDGGDDGPCAWPCPFPPHWWV